MATEDFNAAVQRLWHESEQFLQQGQVEEARASAQQLTELLRDPPETYVANDPDHAAALGLLAYTEFLSGRHEEADAHYAESIELSRQRGEASGIKLGRSLLSFAISLIQRQRNDEALAALSEAVEAMRSAGARLESQAMDLLREISRRAASLGDVALAEAALLAVIDPYEKAGRPDSVKLAAYYDALGQVRFQSGEYADAEAPARMALEMALAEGRGPRDIATLSVHLADVLIRLGRQDEVIALADRILELAGDDATFCYRAHEFKGVIDLQNNDSAAAIDNLQIAARNAAEVVGARTPVVANLYERIADLLFDLRRYREALPYREWLVAYVAGQTGSDTVAYGQALNLYAVALDQSGAYADAQQHYRSALRLLSSLLGEHDDEVLTIRRNLAELARIRGEAELAERRFAKLVRLIEECPEAEADGAAQTWLGYGLTLISLGKHDEAAKALDAALKIRRDTQGERSPQVARVLLAKGQLENQRGAHDEALRVLSEALTILRDRPERRGLCDSVELELSIARLYIEPSEASMNAAAAVHERVTESVGENSPESGIYWRNLALTFLALDQPERARAAIERVERASRFEMIEALRAQIDSRANETMEQLQAFQSVHLSLLMAAPDRDEAAVRAGFEMLSTRSGAETLALRLRNRRRFADQSPEVVAEMQALKARLTQLRTQREKGDASPELAAEIGRQEEALEAIESRLGGMVAEWRLDAELLGDDAEMITRGLDETAALVFFTQFAPYVAGEGRVRWEDSRYAAYVLRGADGNITLVDIGPQDTVDGHIEAFRLAVMDYRQSDWREPGLALSGAIFGALQPALEGINELVVIPAGRLAVLPLASLPVDEERFVADRFQINYRMSTRRLSAVLYEEDIGKGSDPVVIGAPDYGSAVDRLNDPLDDSDFLGQFRAGGRFQPLPEARVECLEIAGLLGVDPHLDQAASEAVLFDLASPEMLHVATHGFFLARKTEKAAPAESTASQFGLPEIPGRMSLLDPLERSGLAFAGVNTYLDGHEPPAPAGDGILYAAEVAGLDFMRTDLVTLSACQTGLGEMRSGDAVHGLQRAFVTAGARCVVSSLWEVPEKPTRLLFRRFYERILNGEPRGAAFHAVLQELAQQYSGLPVAWGGFVLYGDTTVLPRFDPVRQLNVVSMRWPDLVDRAQREIDTALSNPEASVAALMAAGVSLLAQGDTDGAIAAYTRVADDAGTSLEERSSAVYERAGIWRSKGAYDRALADYDWLENTPGISERRRMMGRGDRGTTLMLAGQPSQAAACYTSVLDWPGLATDERAFMLVNRAFAFLNLGREKEALDDLAEVIGNDAMPEEQRAKALANRADLYVRSGYTAEAEADARALLAMEGAPGAEVAGGYISLGRALAAQGRTEDARAAYRDALATDGIPEHFVQGVRKLLAALEEG